MKATRRARWLEETIHNYFNSPVYQHESNHYQHSHIDVARTYDFISTERTRSFFFAESVLKSLKHERQTSVCRCM